MIENQSNEETPKKYLYFQIIAIILISSFIVGLIGGGLAEGTHSALKLIDASSLTIYQSESPFIQGFTVFSIGTLIIMLLILLFTHLYLMKND